MLLAEMGKRDMAEQLFRRLCNANGNRKDIWFFKALVLFTVFKKFKPALRNALKALQFDPNNPDLLFIIGACKAELGAT
jgi:tetratricopeptide (TPR) repeat protein